MRSITLRRLLAALGVAAVAAGAIVAILAGGDEPDGPPTPVRARSDVATDGPFRYHMIQGRCGYGAVVTATQNVPPREGEFCLVTVDVTNQGQAPGRLRQECQYLIDASGRRHRIRSDVLALEEESLEAFQAQLEAGQEVPDVAFYFDVPEGTEVRAVELHSTCDSRGVRIPLALQGTTPVEE